MDRAKRAKAFLRKVTDVGTLESLRAEPNPALEMMVAPETVPPGGLDLHRLPDVTRSAAEKVLRDTELTRDEQFALEAIIIPGQRPAVDIIDGDFEVTMPLFASFSQNPQLKSRITSALPSVGRIEVSGFPGLPYGGTGFVVGPALLMTNRHVAELFTTGLGTVELKFRAGMGAGIDFRQERGHTESQVINVRRVVMIHPFWDMALLETEGPFDHPPLRLSLEQPEVLQGRAVAVVGYPAFDPRNPGDVQNAVFGGAYNVKRLLPGVLGSRRNIASFGHTVSAITHDASTLGGNSGSAVFDPSTGAVVGLHFAGLYLDANFFVPAWELARDDRVLKAGTNFERPARGDLAQTSAWWTGVETAVPIQAQTHLAVSGPAQPEITHAAEMGSATTWTIPIEVTVRLGSASRTPASATTFAEVAGVERAVEPQHETDYSSRGGYRPDFLGLTVPFPQAADPGLCASVLGGGIELRYHHFSVVMHRLRRLALFTAVNVARDPAKKSPERGHDYTRDGLGGLNRSDTERWFPDPRIALAHQLSDKFFTRDNGAFDKGHIVRREDAAWGDTYREVQAANGDTFHVTNCSPQVAGFNRPDGTENWGDLEKYVAAQGRSDLMSIIAGPILAGEDPTFLGVDTGGPVRVQIPRSFWKVVLTVESGALRAFAFVLNQDLSATPLEFTVNPAWRARMLSLSDLQQRLQLVRFPQVMLDADQSGTEQGRTIRRMAQLE